MRYLSVTIVAMALVATACSTAGSRDEGGPAPPEQAPTTSPAIMMEDQGAEGRTIPLTAGEPSPSAGSVEDRPSSTEPGGQSGTGGRDQGAGSVAEVWRAATLRDVATGEEFSISGLRGKVVAIAAMATWCVNCRAQHGQTQAALEQLASPDIVYISLAVDPNEREADLAAYAARGGFSWRFAVASPEVSRSLAATFGDQILSPPATPLVVLGPEGELVAKQFGIKGSDDLVALLEQALP
jgi:thiol-disulfide isomerase/thioredoxin